MKKINILYLYDFENWAIHNVGKTWSASLPKSFNFTFMEYGLHYELDPTHFDHVIIGFSTLASIRKPKVPKIFAPKVFRWLPFINKFITVVHDPCEIFDSIPDWKNLPVKLKHLNCYSRIGVTSNEMYSILEPKLRNQIFLINTIPNVEIKQLGLNLDQLRLITKTAEYARKNIAQLNRIENYANETGVPNEFIIGKKNIFSDNDYIKFLDKGNCYVCTSWQEGGPLPLMEAVTRGNAVLTTSVGQTDHWVIDGYNGFICSSDDDFYNKIDLLSVDQDLLKEMRSNSLEIAKKNFEINVADQFLKFIN